MANSSAFFLIEELPAINYFIAVSVSIISLEHGSSTVAENGFVNIITVCLMSMEGLFCFF